MAFLTPLQYVAQNSHIDDYVDSLPVAVKRVKSGGSRKVLSANLLGMGLLVDKDDGRFAVMPSLQKAQLEKLVVMGEEQGVTLEAHYINDKSFARIDTADDAVPTINGTPFIGGEYVEDEPEAETA